MIISALSDPSVWDNYETISLTSTRTTAASGGSLIDADILAKGRAPTFKEQAKSGGVYTSQDKVWLVPVLNTTFTALKPADTVTDADGNVWTVLEAALNTWKSFWRLMTRNLVLAFDLKDQISIQRATITYDAAGAPVRAWPDNNVAGVSVAGSTPYGQVAARVQLLRQEEAEERGLRGKKSFYDVIIGQQVVLALAGQDRVKWLTVPASAPTAYLDIDKLRDPLRIDELPVLECHAAL
jgi:hypothetical protein